MSVCDESLAKSCIMKKLVEQKVCCLCFNLEYESNFQLLVEILMFFDQEQCFEKDLFDLDEKLFTRHYRLCREAVYK